MEIKNLILVSILKKVSLLNHHHLKKILTKKHLKNLLLIINNCPVMKIILPIKLVRKFLIKMHQFQNYHNPWINFLLVETKIINLALNLTKNPLEKVTLTCLNFLKDNSNLNNKNSILCFKNLNPKLLNWDYQVCKTCLNYFNKVLIILILTKLMLKP